MNKSLKTLFTLQEFNKLHHKRNMSIYEIAEQYKTYPNKIRRCAAKLGAKIRNKSEAQKIALKTGRQKHPTEGTKRNEEVKIKISESVAASWENIDDKERKRRSQLAKDQWNNMTAEDKKSLHTKAYIAIRNAAKNGSKLEREILQWLINEGYMVTFHKQHIIGNEKMHLDILIKNKAIAIEVDGPSHSTPIWGQDKLMKSQAADIKKDGLLLNMGFSIIRIVQKKDLTKKLVRDILYELKEVLNTLETKKNTTKRFVIGE